MTRTVPTQSDRLARGADAIAPLHLLAGIGVVIVSLTLATPTSPPVPSIEPPPPPTRSEKTSKRVTRVLQDGSRITMVAKTTAIQHRREMLRWDLLVGGTVTLLLVVGVAAAIPALRASRVAPVVALKAE